MEPVESVPGLWVFGFELTVAVEFLARKDLSSEFGGVRQWTPFSVGSQVKVWFPRRGVGPSASPGIGLRAFHWGLVLELVWRVCLFSDECVLLAEF